jgi:hypothetical protein
MQGFLSNYEVYSTPMDKIIVDIDNTLWNFAAALYNCLKEANLAVPTPDGWYEWEFWTPYISEKHVYSAIDRIHLEQDRFSPYPDAARFLATLKERGFYIVIASHRRQDTLDPTVRWLERNNLTYDEVHLSYDKTVLFDGSWGIVDDSPTALNKAREAGIVRTGLRHPWNAREDHPLFNDLSGILDYIEGCGR